MTPRQIELARHALGLPNERNKSYRNRFCASPGHEAYGDWTAMVDAGDAVTWWMPGKRLPGTQVFNLTPKGAAKAVEDWEALDPEDFPEVKAGRPQCPENPDRIER